MVKVCVTKRIFSEFLSNGGKERGMINEEKVAKTLRMVELSMKDIKGYEEKNFWGTSEAMAKYLRSVRRPGEERNGYDNRPGFEYAVMDMESIGEAGETILAELMKMKEPPQIGSESAKPRVAVAI